MAIALSTTSSYYARTTNLPVYSAWTMMAWISINDVLDSFQYNLSYGDSSGSRFVALGSDMYTSYFIMYNGTTDVNSSPAQVLSNNTWYHFAVSNNGASSGLLGYMNGTKYMTTTAHSSCSAEQIRIGSNIAGDNFTGKIAAYKLYSAVLTVDEIVNEMMCYVPVRTANLNTWCPFLNVESTDYSGNGYTLTPTGTPTQVDGPPIAWGFHGVKRIFSAAGGAPPAAPKRNPMILMGV
jgi:hypothetical protein